jgi:hypothetical protein
MIINEIKHGGMEVWFVADELFQLALLMDQAAHIVQESPDWEVHPKGIVEHLELMGALFTASAVACQGQNGHAAWFKREKTVPTLHKPE